MECYRILKNKWTTTYINIKESQKQNDKQKLSVRESTYSIIPFVSVLETGQTKQYIRFFQKS